MAPNRSFAIPPRFNKAIAELPVGDAPGRRIRAVARLLEAGLRPQEIVELDTSAVGDPETVTSFLATPSPFSVRICGRKARVVQLDPVAAADLAGFQEDRRAGLGAVASSDIDDAVAAVSVKAGTKLRAHDFRVIAATRIAAATTEEDRRRARRELGDLDGEGLP